MGRPSLLEQGENILKILDDALVFAPEAAQRDHRSIKNLHDLSQVLDRLLRTLAVDRGNESVTHLYRPLHPAVLRLIDFTVRSAVAKDTPVSLCGEMAADPALAPLLVGFGLRELSVEPRALPGVAEALRKLSVARARELATHALTLESAEDVARLLQADGTTLADRGTR